MDKGRKFLSELKLYTDYLKWDEKKQRYETWEEACENVLQTHIDKYGDVAQPLIDKVLTSYQNREFLASQRNLQFRSKQIQQHNARIYNCVTGYVCTPDAFAKGFYLLLCGCGLGIHLGKKYVQQLPNLHKRSDKVQLYSVEDSIEGWANALHVLISSYCKHPSLNKSFFGKQIKFDFSNIRPKGALITGGFKAPGHEGLQNSLAKIENLINSYLGDNDEVVFKSIIVYDIFMYSSDAVLSGGVRRSAMIVIMDEDDIELVNAKTGDWRQTNPQRARSNNSVLLLRDTFTKKQFKNFLKKNEGDNDIGFVFADHEDSIYNPCQPSWATVLTKDGISTIGEISEGMEIWSEDGWVKVTKKWSTGNNDVYKYRTNSGVFYGTSGHKVVSRGKKVEAQNAESIDVLCGPESNIEFDAPSIMDGLVIGDGSVHKASNNLVTLYIGDKDQDYFDSEVSNLICRERKGIGPHTWEIQTTISSVEMDVKPNIEIPDRIIKSNSNIVASFLRGLYSANGSICGSRVTLKSASSVLVEQVQIMLSSIGIRSYITKNVKSDNGEYLCKASYDINITIDRQKFANKIGFIQEYKNKKLNKIVESTNCINGKSTFDIYETEFISNEETFDITVNGVSHTYWTGGCNVSNCAEIGFNFYDKIKNKNIAAYQFCNLVEINASACTNKTNNNFNEDKFYELCDKATIVGTLQAGFTDFPFLGKQTEEIVKGEALLGVSVTGWMARPELFNPEILQTGANICRETNTTVAKLIGINESARITTSKPSGNASVILMSESGIKPAHSRRGFRIMQINKDSETSQWLEQNCPQVLEESVWSANNTDYVVFAPYKNHKNVITQDNMKGVRHLELIKLVQENWVVPGKKKELCYNETSCHNVSNTVVIDNINEITDYLFDNQNSFSAVSFISDYGDKDFNQAPFTSVLNTEELIDKYGDGAIFMSGLIVDGLHYFDNDLWSACDHILSPEMKLVGTRVDVLLKQDWIKRAKKFAQNYFNNDLRQLVYCMKDVSLWHKWNVIDKSFKKINFSEILTKPEYQDIANYASVACSGGQCEIVR